MRTGWASTLGGGAADEDRLGIYIGRGGAADEDRLGIYIGRGAAGYSKEQAGSQVGFRARSVGASIQCSFSKLILKLRFDLKTMGFHLTYSSYPMCWSCGL